MDTLNRRGKAVAVRLRGGVHPKHLIENPDHEWYLGLLHPADHVLDLGCGNGAHTRRAAVRCAWVYGIDRTPPRDPTEGVSWITGDITAPLPVPLESIDAVLALDVIEHVHARQTVLAEIRRVLTPVGLLFITGPNRETTWRRRLCEAGVFAYSDPDHKIEYSRVEFAEELRAGGFDVLSMRPIVYDTRWAGAIDALGGLSLPLYRRLSAWRRRMAARYPSETTGWRAVCMKRPEP
jgi:SAM-dependent methyltransferase